MTAYEHAWEIRKAYGLRVLEDEGVSAEFRRFLDGRAWTHAEGPGALFDHGVGWLRRNLVLLPGISVLLRLVAAVREAAADRMHGLLASAADAADPMLAGRLRDALGVPPGAAWGLRAAQGGSANPIVISVINSRMAARKAMISARSGSSGCTTAGSCNANSSSSPSNPARRSLVARRQPAAMCS